jgi:hypothetical protein
MERAKLAPQFISKPVRYLSDLQVGEEGAVGWTEMRVDVDSHCYLNPKAKLRDPHPLFTVNARRRETGFEVSFTRDGGFEWTPREFVSDDLRRTWFPVLRLTYLERAKREE